MRSALCDSPNEIAAKHKQWTFFYGPMIVLPILLLLGQWRDRIVFDRVQGTLRLVRVSLFNTSVRREEPLASVRGAKITGALGASWQFAVEL